MNACKSAGVDDMIIVGFDGNASAVDLILAGRDGEGHRCPAAL